jgi:hypothetical protein
MGVLSGYFSKTCAHKKYKESQRGWTGVDNEQFRDLSMSR